MGRQWCLFSDQKWNIKRFAIVGTQFWKQGFVGLLNPAVVYCLPLERRYDCDIRRSQYLALLGAPDLQCNAFSCVLHYNANHSQWCSALGGTSIGGAQWSDQSPNMPPMRSPPVLSLSWHHLTSPPPRRLICPNSTCSACSPGIWHRRMTRHIW